MYLSILSRVTFLFLLIVPIVSVAEEKIKMEGMSIIGNKESPNLLYIVPWKSPKIPDLDELMISSRLFDEGLKPIDREVFVRKELYRQAKKYIFYNR